MTPRNMPALPAFIASLEVTVPIDQVDVTVKACGVEQLAMIVHLAAPVLDELVLLPEDLLGRLETGTPGPMDLMEVLRLFDGHREAAIEMVAIAAGQPRAWVAGLLPDRFAYLFALVGMVNADFFWRARPVFGAAGALLVLAKASQEKASPAASTGLPSTTP